MGNKLVKPGEVNRHYDLKETLGTGSFATVKRAIRKKDKREFAIKIIKKSKLNEEELAVVHDEVNIMHSIEHENCVMLYEMFESNKKVFMVLELLEGGELFDRIVARGSYSESDASALIKCIVSAIEYLHSVGVVHRDLKPENLIYANPMSSKKNADIIKITDFGLAKYNTDKSQRMSTACGTPGYVAPEVLKNEKYGPPVDMWSIGVILYILLCGFPPFYHESTSALYKQIKGGKYDFPDPYWTEISQTAKSLVAGLLTVDPNKRLTPRQVLEHEWIAGGNASSNPLGHGKRLRLMQLKRKLRRGVKCIIALNKFKVALEKVMETERPE